MGAERVGVEKWGTTHSVGGRAAQGDAKPSRVAQSSAKQRKAERGGPIHARGPSTELRRDGGAGAGARTGAGADVREEPQGCGKWV